jgi:hypothetical protein
MATSTYFAQHAGCCILPAELQSISTPGEGGTEVAQYKTVPVSDTWSTQFFGGLKLDEAIAAETERQGKHGWRVDRIVRSDDGKSADIQFISG